MKLLGFRKPRRKDEDAMRFMQTHFSDRELSRPFEKLVEDHTGEISTEAVTGDSVARMSRKNFLRYSALLGIGAAVGSKLAFVGGSPPLVNWNLGAGSLVLPSSYVLFQDSTATIFTRNGFSGKVDNNFTDFGAACNFVHAQLPVSGGAFYENTGGMIFIKKSSFHYKYSTTPLISKSYVVIIGEGRSTILEPSANVDGITIQSPSGTGLLAPEIRNLGVYDPLANGVGKAYIVLDSGANTENIVHGIIDNIYYWGGPAQASGTGKLIQQKGQGAGAFGLSGTVADFVISNIMAGSNFLQYAGSAPNLPMSASDSILDFQAMFDCTFQNWLIAFHNYYGTNPWITGHATQRVNCGNEWYNIKLLTDSSTSPISCVSLNNEANNYFEDLFYEIGAVTAGTICLELAGYATVELRVRRIRMDNCDIGIQWDANAVRDNTFSVDCIIDDINASRMGTCLKSIAGDASLKVFHGGSMQGTTLMNPNPLTGAQFYHVSRGLIVNPEWGWLVTTPAVPVGTGIGNARTNNTGVPVMVVLSSPVAYAQAPYGTHVIDQAGNDVLLSGDWSAIYLSPGAQIYFATAVPASWKWYGV